MGMVSFVVGWVDMTGGYRVLSIARQLLLLKGWRHISLMRIWLMLVRLSKLSMK
jgi:hypothetical protein